MVASPEESVPIHVQVVRKRLRREAESECRLAVSVLVYLSCDMGSLPTHICVAGIAVSLRVKGVDKRLS